MPAPCLRKSWLSSHLQQGLSIPCLMPLALSHSAFCVQGRKSSASLSASDLLHPNYVRHGFVFPTYEAISAPLAPPHTAAKNHLLVQP